MRWGSRGSVWCCITGQDKGRWYNHEADRGGDLLDLIACAHGVSLAEAIGIARDRFLGDTVTRHQLRPPPSAPPSAPTSTAVVLPKPDPAGPDPDKEAKAATAMRWWSEGVDLPGTTGEVHIAKTRGIDFGRLPPLSHCLRWHAGIGALVGRLTDPATGEPVRGVQRIFVHPDGTNVVDVDEKGRTKNRKRTLGYSGVVCLSPPDEVTLGLGLTEGIEDGLAVLAAGWAPIWCTIGTSNMRNFPVLSGIEELTIFADADEGGMAAANACAERWRASSRAATIVAPR